MSGQCECIDCAVNASEAARLRIANERLRALITAWVNADDAFETVHAGDAPERLAYVEASEALRKAVGR